MKPVKVREGIYEYKGFRVRKTYNFDRKVRWSIVRISDGAYSATSPTTKDRAFSLIDADCVQLRTLEAK